ncbi:MAG: restriction endonuclease [Rickettsiales bacterium]|nr:restriction endonuclease [Rickettsiales bacterium]
MEFLERSASKIKEDRAPEIIEQEDPETRIERAIEGMEAVLVDEILTSLKNIHPKKFEQVVVDLMVAMNYGVGKTTQYVVDGGIDGIIDEDELGLSKIYLQAKRYSDGKVQEKEMRNFMGALADKPVGKGVFITTSIFSDKAINMAHNSKHHVVRPVDGRELAELMIKHNLGVRLKKGYEVKEIDNSFFEE